MKYAVAILAAATSALAQSSPWGGAWNGTSVAYTTIVTTAITTYCSGATQLTYGDRTYTVTEATTLTITDCPCTLTQPIYTPTLSTVLYTSCPPGAASTEAPAAPSVSTPVNNALAYSNPLTISYATPTVTFKPNGGFATGTGVYPTKTASYSGAANANSVTGLFVGAVAGVVAMAL